MIVQCPSCKTMVSFEDDGRWPASGGVDIWRVLLRGLFGGGAILKSPAGDDLSTCPSCGASLLTNEHEEY